MFNDYIEGIITKFYTYIYNYKHLQTKPVFDLISETISNKGPLRLILQYKICNLECVV